MPEINPTRINQAPVDTGAEISPDGGIIQQQAAPSAAPRTAPQVPASPAPTSMTELEQVAPDGTTVKPAPTTPEVPENIDFTEFLKAKGEDQKPAEPVTSTPPEVTPKAPITVKDDVTPVAPKFPAGQRDYSDIDEADVPLFKQMHNESFAKLKPIYLAHKKQQAEIEQLKKQVTEVKSKPESIYEHEQGFVLTPEFKTASYRVSLTNAIFQHWQKQLDAINGGAGEYTMIEVDQNGELVETGKVTVDPKSADEVRLHLNHAQNQRMREQVELNTIAKNHSVRFKDAASRMQQFVSQSFSFFDTPGGQKELGPQVDFIISKLPDAYQSNPLAVPFAKALITLQLMARMNKNSAAPATTAGNSNGSPAPVITQQRRAGPTAADVGAGSGGGHPNSPAEVTIDMFEQAKQGY